MSPQTISLRRSHEHSDSQTLQIGPRADPSHDGAVPARFLRIDGEDLNEHGLFAYGDLDYFWFEPTHAAYIITLDEKLAGFALVDNEVMVEGNERSMTEFFVLRKYRRKGVGAAAATQVFGELPAPWEVRVIEANRPAQDFWRKVIAQYSRGQYTEVRMDTENWTGPVFSFDNRAPYSPTGPANDPSPGAARADG